MLRVSEIFRSIQGEGINTGIPMSFIRLQGCSVGCSWCDTKYTWDLKGGVEMTAKEILNKCPDDYVCITGGEPAQANDKDLTELIQYLDAADKYICVETSGVGSCVAITLADHITLSPKSHKPPSGAFCKMANEIKIIVCTEEDIEAAIAYSIYPAEVVLQPVSGSEKAKQIVLDAAFKWGFRTSFQLHKFLGLE